MKILLRITIMVVALVAIVAITGFIKFNFSDNDIILPSEKKDVLNFKYNIDGQEFQLKNGSAEVTIAENSATKNKLSTFGDPVELDADKDGDMDYAVLLAHEPGGSGTFFYATLVVNNAGELKQTNALFLGDRIAPQNINVVDGRAVFNYAERLADESMATAPSVGKSLYIQLTSDGTIGEFVPNFEGEADPSRMKLTDRPWSWVKTTYEDGNEVLPKSDKFKITFGKDGRASIATDCNSMGGGYTVTSSSLKFEALMSTLMYCEGSQEAEFSGAVSGVTKYHFTSKGELILSFNGGEVILK